MSLVGESADAPATTIANRAHRQGAAGSTLGMVTLGSLFALLGAVAALALVFLSHAWGSADASRRVFIGQELVKGVLQIALVAVGGGVVAFLFQRYNADKERHLKDLDAAHQKNSAILGVQLELIERIVTVANTLRRTPILIEAHRSAKTYGEQMRLAIDARFELEQWCQDVRGVNVFDDWETIKTLVECMKAYLCTLETAYRDNYQELAKLQRAAELDETKRPEVWEAIKALPAMRDVLAIDRPPPDSREFTTKFLEPYGHAMVAMKKAVARRQGII